MKVREAIRAQNRLARMRMGQDVGERVAIPSMPEIGCIQVPLLESEVQAGVIAAASLDVIDNAAGLHARNRAALQSDVFHSLREPEDITKKVFESPEHMADELDATDIDYLADHLALLSEHASPTIDGLDDKELEDLKKAFGETDWSALTGRRWAAVKLCCSTLFPELLQAKLRGFTSTDSLTETSENEEFISSASQS